MYFVGKESMFIHRKGVRVQLLPGSEIPEAKEFSNLRQLMQSGRLACDYKHGEKNPSTMSPVTRSATPTLVETARKRLAEWGQKVPERALDREVIEAYEILQLFKDETKDKKVLKKDEPDLWKDVLKRLAEEDKTHKRMVARRLALAAGEPVATRDDQGTVTINQLLRAGREA